KTIWCALTYRLIVCSRIFPPKPIAASSAMPGTSRSNRLSGFWTLILGNAIELDTCNLLETYRKGLPGNMFQHAGTNQQCERERNRDGPTVDGKTKSRIQFRHHAVSFTRSVRTSGSRPTALSNSIGSI